MLRVLAVGKPEGEEKAATGPERCELGTPALGEFWAPRLCSKKVRVEQGGGLPAPGGRWGLIDRAETRGGGGCVAGFCRKGKRKGLEVAQGLGRAAASLGLGTREAWRLSSPHGVTGKWAGVCGAPALSGGKRLTSELSLHLGS